MTLFAVVEIITGTAAVLNTDYYTVDKDTATVATVVAFLVPRTPIGTTAVEGTVTGTTAGTSPSDSMTVTANSQADSAFLVTDNTGDVSTWSDVTAFTLDAANFGTAGDIVEIIGVPDPTVDGNWTGIDYVRSLDITPGQMIEPVPSDMEPQLVTRRMRMEHSFDISGEYVDNNTGIATIRGREVSVMVEHHEDGGPVVSEYIILGNAAIQDAPISAPDNAPITISTSSTYRRRLIYAP
jgi:hypothetical protein